MQTCEGADSTQGLGWGCDTVEGAGPLPSPPRLALCTWGFWPLLDAAPAALLPVLAGPRASWGLWGGRFCWSTAEGLVWRPQGSQRLLAYYQPDASARGAAS